MKCVKSVIYNVTTYLHCNVHWKQPACHTPYWARLPVRTVHYCALKATYLPHMLLSAPPCEELVLPWVTHWRALVLKLPCEDCILQNATRSLVASPSEATTSLASWSFGMQEEGTKPVLCGYLPPFCISWLPTRDIASAGLNMHPGHIVQSDANTYDWNY
jgi:hypothetical protein